MAQNEWAVVSEAPISQAVSTGWEVVEQQPIEKQSAFRQIADVPLGVAKGAVQGVRMIADAFGAGSDTSNTIKSAETYLADLMSAQAKNDQQEIARIMKDAEDKGVLDQVKAGIKAFTVAPIDTLSTALGTAAPVIAGALGSQILGAGALVGAGVSALTGAAMGAGTIKGSIYQETKNALKEAGASEQDAESKAQLAQEYGGKNLDQILLGTVIGGAAALGPLEKGGAAILARKILGKTGVEATESVATEAAKGVLRRKAEAGLLEAAPEAFQAGQEQVAQNIALQREGFDVPTFRGAVGAATLEGIAGAGLGAAIGGGKPEVAAPVAPPAPEAPVVEPSPPVEEEVVAEAEAPPLALEYKPDPLISYPDGSIARRGEVETYIQSLPEEEQIPARAKLLGMGQEPTQITPEMLKNLGIRSRAPIIQRLSGLELTDPQITEELTSFASQSYASPEVRGNIYGFLNTLKPVEASVAEAPVVEAEPVAPAAPTVTETPAIQPTVEPPQPPVRVEPSAAEDRELVVPTVASAAETPITKPSRNSESWRTEGKTPQQLIADKIEIESVELARQIAVEASAQDFAPNELPKSIQQWASDAKIPADDLRQSVIKALDKFDISDARKAQVKKALSPLRTAPAAPTVEPAEPKAEAPKVITAQVLTDLGVKPTAAVVKRLEGKPFDDPEVVTQLESYAKRYAPAEIKPAITNFVQTIKAPVTQAAPVAPPPSQKQAPQSGLSGTAVGGAPAAAPKPQPTTGDVTSKKFPKTVMGSTLLAAVNRKLGGLDPSLISEFSTRFETARKNRYGKPIVQYRNPLIPGYGKLFRTGGTLDFQLIAEALEDEGYLAPGSVESDYKAAGERAKQLINAALNRQEVEKEEDSAEQLLARRAEMEQMDAEELAAAQEAQEEGLYPGLDEESIIEAEREREAIITELDIDMTVLTDDDINFFGEIAAQSDEEYAESLRRGLGLNDEEVANEIKARAAARSAEEDGRARAREAKEAGSAGEDAPGIASYTPEEVTRKQEEKEKAAAAEKQAKVAEQDRLRKEQQAKEEKARADESVKDFELGKTADEQMTGMGDLFAEPPVQPKREPRQGTQKQLEDVDGHAKDVGGNVVYQEGDLALVQGFSILSGQPVYIVVNGGYRSKVDIEGYTGNLVTPAQKAELVKLKQEFEAEDKAKFDKAPSIKFTDGLATSSGVSAEIAGIVRGWKDLLGLKPNLYITTIGDAVADRKKFTGPYRAIGSAGLDEREAGVVRRLPNGDYYIAFKKGSSKTKMLEVLAHELGHMHEREVFNNADAATQKQIRGEHEKWLMSQQGKSAKELIISLRAKTSGKTTRVEKGLPADQLTPYWKSFGEWYADQVSRWAVTSEKPVSVVEKFFSRLAQALKSFYSKLKNAGYLPNETFVQYLEKASSFPERISTDDALSAQMLGEAKGITGKATEKAQEILQKQKMPKEGLEHIPEDLRNKVQPIFFPQNKTVIDRIRGMEDKFWQRMAQGIADQYRSIKEYSPVAYMQARLSKSIDGGLEGLMFHGHVFNDGGALNIRPQTQGLIEILKPIGKELDSYLMWVALNRESQLPDKKRSKIANMDYLVKNKDTFAAGTLNGKPRIEVYTEIAKKMNLLNKSVLDIALSTGLIDQTGYNNFSKSIYYVPFYRVMEGGDINDVQTASGLTSQEFSKELKGGEAPFGDLMENILRNWNHILSASMKNQAANSTLKAAIEQGAAELNLKPGLEWKDGKVYSTESGKPVSEVLNDDGTVKYKAGELRGDLTKGGAGLAKIVENGQTTYYKVTDPLLMDAISSIGYLGPKNKFLDVAKDFKNLLQFGVTLSPAFKVNNLIRDSVSAMGVSELKKNPVMNVITGLSFSDPNDPRYISALAGGAIFTFGTAYEGDTSKLVKRLVAKGVDRDTILDTDESIKKGMRKIWDKYQEWGNKSESANRMALYTQLRDKGMSHLEASFKARDLLDFSMQGSWGAIRLVTQVVPFMNARIQGLYKLGRDGIIPTTRVLYNSATGKEIDATDKQKAQAFLTITTAVGLASAALYLAFKDDEEFKKRDQWDRDNFWWIKLPNMDAAVRVPKPFEIGAFGTLIERTLEQILVEGAEGKQFGDSISRIVWDTFAMNPMPQMFKPLVDLYANKDSFTGAPIESVGMERLSKQERQTNNTSEIAKVLGSVSSLFPEKFEISPLQADYLVKGYFGWLGATAAVVSNYATMPFKEGEYPDARWLDRMSVGLVKELPSAQSAYVTSFYDNSKIISQAMADMRHYAEMGDSEKVQQILEEQGDKIALGKFYDKTAKTMANIRKQINIVTADKNISGAEKKIEIDRMKLIISDLAKQAEEVRKSMKKS